MASALDLRQQLSFYGSYHNNKWNKLIHVVFVPTIVWTLLVWLAAIGPLESFPFVNNRSLLGQLLSNLPTTIQPLLVFNLGAVFITIYSLYYITLEPFAGFTASVLLVGLWLSANKFALVQANAVSFAVVLHIFSWTMQFIGHGVVEGRKPALLDSLLQSFVLAPLFVWFEVLFTFGYRPKLHAEIQQQISKNIASFKAKKA
eukprot:TRINITY_DN622_c0_g1_i1.p1 TRINITY_DN622_c0_g1~~TRINITY_DN622_c0_g1_i1.p1  ORF type:complete len:202 (+),score=30.67 TRINITY_DN622_c0_g1_i1:187-792(+)